ncbi:MAG TPA: hybrid sensor histidine kinase/response regulator, partial [Polyangia bacterium]
AVDTPMRASILLVDDVPANLLALEAVLEPLGHRLFKARSGDEALRLLLEHDFNLILMDVMMPELDGYQTVALIKRRPTTVNVPVVFVSALATEVAQITKGYRYGAIDYITKPFDGDIVRAKVSVLVTLSLQAERIVRQREQLLQHRQELERQQLERKAAVEASAMKDRLLAMISHELRSPLNQIVGWTDMLVNGKLDGPNTRVALEMIAESAAVQCRLVDDLVDASRIVLGKLSIERRSASLRSVLRVLIERHRLEASEKGIALTNTIELHSDACAHIDPIRLSQALTNLLGNAIKFTPAGGSVDVRLWREGDRALVEVADRGIGIERKDLPFVFDRFWQVEQTSGRHHHGLGLGLAIARQIIELHGGTIEARSDGIGRGATFAVTLPLTNAAEEDRGASA